MDILYNTSIGYLIYCAVLFIFGLKVVVGAEVDEVNDESRVWQVVVWDLPLRNSFSGAMLISARTVGSLGAWVLFALLVLLLPVSPLGRLWVYFKSSAWAQVANLAQTGLALVNVINGHQQSLSTFVQAIKAK